MMEKTNILRLAVLLYVAAFTQGGKLSPSAWPRRTPVGPPAPIERTPVERAPVDIAPVEKVPIEEEISKVTKPTPTAPFQVKIVNGDDANPGEYPYQAQLLKDGSHRCGGSLVHSCYVLTAKHCTQGQDKTRLRVRLGEHQRSTSDSFMTEHDIITIIEHPTIDVALILLTPSADLTNPRIGTIALADTNPALATPATVTGWGQTLSSVSASLADILQEVTIPIASSAVCSASLPGTLQSHEICAGSPTGTYTNACHGDSGGPLVVNTPAGTVEQVGVVSWGNGGCPSSSIYAVYVSVAQVRPWIIQHLPTTTPPAGTNCHCVHPAIQHDGTPAPATFDGANCYIAPARTGCQHDDQETKSFIYDNRYYIKSSAATLCPDGSFDSCNCFIMNKPSGGFIYHNKFYQSVPASGSCPSGTSYDGANCLIKPAPWATTAFEYQGKYYTTARKQCAEPSQFLFDSQNCRYYRSPGPNPFILNNHYYSNKLSSGNCPTGSSWDGAHCHFRQAPWATSAFLHANQFYSTPRRQCHEGAFDGANCLMGRPPIGANAFIWDNKYYYGWN